MKKALFGLLVILLLLGAVACVKEDEPREVMSGVNGGVIMTQVPAPTTISIAPPVKGNETYGDVSYDSSSPATIDRMVIRSAYLTLVVDNVSASLIQINDLAKSYGGFVVNSNISEDQSRLYAYISFRVLSERFDDTLQALRHLAVDVRSESTSGEDVTEEYTDLVSRLRNLEAAEAQLLELMKLSGKVEEILAVQKELTNVRGEIEVIKGRMQYLEQSSNLALFTVTLEQSKLIVEFTAETRTVKEGNSVYFYPNVSGGFYPYSYEWSFGDGETSTEANPSHVYHTGGTFTVTLKVTDDKGTVAVNERLDYITVLSGWSAGDIVSGAWSAMVGFGHFLASFFIWLGILSPIWIAVLVILYFTWWRRRKSRA